MKRSERLKRWHRTGRSYKGLAAEIGCAVTSVREAVLGQTKRPKPEIAEAVARAMGVAEEDLFLPPRPTLERAA